MKLIKVNHERCNEWEGTEYFVVPHEMTDEEVWVVIRQVREEMLSEARRISEYPERPAYQIQYSKYPDKTVSEVQRIHAEALEAYERWKKENDRLSRSFATRMSEQGITPHNQAEVQSFDIDWGHNHSLDLQYERSHWSP